MNKSEITSEIEITTLGFKGKGIGRIKNVNTKNGKVVFVPFVLPGEVVAVEYKHEKKDYIEANPVEIIKSSLQRIKPECKYFTVCGGCHFQHLNNETQLLYKEEILHNMLMRSLKINLENIPIIGSKNIFNYRKRVSFKVKNQKWGFYQFESHDFIPVDECKIAHTDINNYISKNKPQNRDEIEIAIDDLNNISDINPKKMTLDLSEIVKNLHIVYNSFDFVQVNKHTNIEMIKTVISWLDGHNNILELYSGFGNFSLPLAIQGHKITSFDMSKSAIDSLRQSSSKYKVSIEASTLNLNQPIKINKNYDAVLLDPPRAGAKHGINLINKTKPEVVVYVSCDPTTLVRDISNLKDYKIDDIIIFDMFPQTYHFETAIKLTRLD